MAKHPPESITRPDQGTAQGRLVAILLLHTDIRESPAERIVRETDALVRLDTAQYLAPHRTVQWPLAAAALPNPLRAPVARNLQRHQRELANGDDSRMAGKQQCQQRGTGMPAPCNVDVGRAPLAGRSGIRHKYVTRSRIRSGGKIVAHFCPSWQPTSSSFPVSNRSLTGASVTATIAPPREN